MHEDLLPDFLASLERLTRSFAAVGLVDWCLFGGAALALQGVSAPVADLDVLIEPDGAQALMTAFDLKNQADSASPQFRSDYLLRPDWGPLPIEIMAGFSICQHGDWQPVALPATQKMQLAGGPVRVATRPALAALFRRCGRPKDLARAALLE